jgi:hypothetical protein|tara:strand:- start:20 stop:313 length:294 start_codon:yes stop_codon:yes gene_type:complete
VPTENATSAGLNLVAELGYSQLDDVRFYLLDGSTVLRTLETGDDQHQNTAPDQQALQQNRHHYPPSFHPIACIKSPLVNRRTPAHRPARDPRLPGST